MSCFTHHYACCCREAMLDGLLRAGVQAVDVLNDEVRRLCAVVSERDATIVTLHSHVEALDAAVREYLAAVDALTVARMSYASATVGGVLVTDAEIVRRHEATVAAEDRVREAERRFRTIVDGARGC